MAIMCKGCQLGAGGCMLQAAPRSVLCLTGYAACSNLSDNWISGTLPAEWSGLTGLTSL
jgi:hypothetical protein